MPTKILFFQFGKIIIQPVDQFHGFPVLKQIRETLRAEFSPVERDDQCFLHGILFNMVFHYLNQITRPAREAFIS